MEYIPHTPEEEQAMLETIGVSRFEDLLQDIPEAIRLQRPLRLPPPTPESRLLPLLESWARENESTDRRICFLGGGAYDHYIPAAVPWILSRSEFLTAYTPYQAEMSQGLLQAIYEYQTLIAELTGMEVANASLYDGGSALAEGAIMARRITRRPGVVLAGAIHPRYRQVVRTYLRGTGPPLQEVPPRDGRVDLEALASRVDEEVGAVLLQHPNFLGLLEDVEAVAQVAHQVGALLVVMVDPLALGVLQAPGAQGADIVVGEGQGLGLPLSYGGPYLGFLASRKQYVRQMPGRIVGATVDVEGQRAFCLTFQTREQHIRRDRATSNICTNQSLMALGAAVYLSLLGPVGLREVGLQCVQKARYLRDRILELPGFEAPYPDPHFKEFVVRPPVPPRSLLRHLWDQGFLGGLDLGTEDPALEGLLLICVTEKRTREEMDRYVACLKELSL